jgi:hypothetical protein
MMGNIKMKKSMEKAYKNFPTEVISYYKDIYNGEF